MNDLPEEESADEEAAPEARIVEISDPTLPDFAPRLALKRWETPEGSVVGFDYEGDESRLMTASDRENAVRAAMARDAQA